MAGLLAIVMYYSPGRGFAAGLGDPVGCTELGGGVHFSFCVLVATVAWVWFLGGGLGMSLPKFEMFLIFSNSLRIFLSRLTTPETIYKPSLLY